MLTLPLVSFSQEWADDNKLDDYLTANIFNFPQLEIVNLIEQSPDIAAKSK